MDERDRKQYWRDYYRKNKEKVKARVRKWNAENREYRAHRDKKYAAKHAGKLQAYRKANTERAREYSLRRKYGLDLADWDVLFKAQGRRCRICKTDTPTSKGWQTDHCHDTKRVRAILCQPCNYILGRAKDNPAVLRAAADYLERTGTAKTKSPRR